MKKNIAYISALCYIVFMESPTKKYLIWGVVLIVVLAVAYLTYQTIFGGDGFIPDQDANAAYVTSYSGVGSKDLIILDSPKPNDEVVSPLTITGMARGTWYFEASFPIVLTNWDGLIIAEGHAQAQGDWMTEEFVPFKAVLDFTSPITSTSTAQDYLRRGTLMLKNDNPSGESSRDGALEIPIRFK
jgi:hypothetical protein